MAAQCASELQRAGPPLTVIVSTQTVDTSKTGHRPSEEQAARAQPQAGPSTLEHVLAAIHLPADEVRRRRGGECWRL